MWVYIIIGLIVLVGLWWLNAKLRLSRQEKQINDYFQSNVTKTAEKIFHTKIAGVTKKNPDGSQ